MQLKAINKQTNRQKKINEVCGDLSKNKDKRGQSLLVLQITLISLVSPGSLFSLVPLLSHVRANQHPWTYLHKFHKNVSALIWPKVCVHCSKICVWYSIPFLGAESADGQLTVRSKSERFCEFEREEKSRNLHNLYLSRVLTLSLPRA